ncbi:DNA polymerase III subunit beta [Pseudidiomarina terrestris]|uniref:Beta sliding clamp n=1 Tax=Pseudidiomarina terrestris TaxID=2820060 RepID=A0AAW7R2P9_9GAMM|nr:MULTISPECIES: DNA polymerase III subunit beta [unclassified Pseudidiomarina]MDN7125388.1 DNA polymerase III subunit beta [Pseudidiomarina sp. 1APP75-32.1]MDN7130146.1 DNA polymerase III subunit beta [Pseudidiomarina sp. 1APR75-15]MDN7135651.1 DNA polymerase III subunit beta [Pseudidiomarina sp. 1ASP75-5]
MKFTINRDAFLKPLQVVSGAVERRHTIPILSNVLIQVASDHVRLTGTDLEVELVSVCDIEGGEEGQLTVPAKKLVDIVRSLPDGAQVEVSASGEKATIRSGRSKFTLATLPAEDFPNIDDWDSDIQLVTSQSVLRELMERTHFSMANQDVRYYLNGMLFETDANTLRTVATDGHRLAMSAVEIPQPNLTGRQVIVPRKGITELMRLLDDADNEVKVAIGANHIRVETNGMSFTSKLVDGRFPDYRRVLPQGGDKFVVADRNVLKQACSRAAILSNEKYRGVRVTLSSGEMCLTANNPEQETAEEVIEVEYEGDSLEIGFNVSYLIDVLNTIHGEKIKMTLSGPDASGLIEDNEDDSSLYVVMPMRL